MIRLDRKTLTAIGRFKGIDTSLFQHEAEWELFEASERLSLVDADIVELNRLAALITGM